jgi:hypothetical protein
VGEGEIKMVKIDRALFILEMSVLELLGIFIGLRELDEVRGNEDK